MSLPATRIRVDAVITPTIISTVRKSRQSNSRLHQADLTGADRETAALKAQFRREDEELRAQGRGDEIVARNRRLLGIREGAKSKLIGVGGKLFV